MADNSFLNLTSTSSPSNAPASGVMTLSEKGQRSRPCSDYESERLEGILKCADA